MRSRRDPVALLRLANPVPDQDLLPESAASAHAEALLEGIIAMDTAAMRRQLPKRKRTLLLAATMVLLGATAAWAYTLSGTFPDPAFSGTSWKLTVGEEANGASGTFKVCHSFQPRAGANMGNGLGVAGCGDWPADAGGTTTGPAIIDTVPAVETRAGVVLFVDLTARKVDAVTVEPNVGDVVTVTPYRMPQSGKQYAVAELPKRASSATVRVLDEDGAVIQTQHVADLTVRQQDEP